MSIVNIVILIFGTVVAGSSLCVTWLIVRSTSPEINNEKLRAK